MNQQKNQNLAVASLILGIIAFLFSFIPCLGIITLILGIMALIFGIIAINRIKPANGNKGMSIAGITMGSIALIVTITWIMFVVGFNSPIKHSIKNLIEWIDEKGNDYEFNNNDNLEIDEADLETLEELEEVLDKLENVTDEIEKEVEDVVNETNSEIKKSLKEAKKEIKDIKSKIKTDTINVVI